MDDIVTRLRGGSEEKSPAWCWHCEEWGCENADGKSAGCQCEDSCDCANECICECHGWFGVVREAADEIERLRTEVDRWKDLCERGMSYKVGSDWQDIRILYEMALKDYHAQRSS